ncbi:hypothetical protein JCM9534A_58340 [Catenuloplanes indicus JCM 9534]
MVGLGAHDGAPVTGGASATRQRALRDHRSAAAAAREPRVGQTLEQLCKSNAKRYGTAVTRDHLHATQINVKSTPSSRHFPSYGPVTDPRESMQRPQRAKKCQPSHHQKPSRPIRPTGTRPTW